MIKPKMIQNEKDLSYCQGHKLHVVVTIALDRALSKNQNLQNVKRIQIWIVNQLDQNKLFNQLKKAKKLSRR
ncbi:unnamed protein product [Paramecium octaurelia]|uniref:Uncharacterized protein n=1 Tax=Paramecium octaurelia TaxID=43137 RepID=A0A8S1X4T5_PAROT|nr:unnamed protein product [Paramecium octaurelia]